MSVEDLLGNLDDIVSMILIQCKDECFGQIVKIGFTLRVGEHLSINRIFICLKNEFDLCWIDDTSIEFFARVVFIFLPNYTFNLSCVNSCLFCLLPLQDSTTILCDFCTNTESAMVHIHTISNGLFKCIVNDNILVKESNRVGYRRCCKTNNTRWLEIVKYFLPTTVYGPMALINNNQIEIISW